MTQTRTSHLPEETGQNDTGKTVLRCWVCVLLVVVMCNGLAFWGLEKNPVNKTSKLMRLKWQLLKQTPGDLDMLILGDSSGNQGVDPDRIKSQLGIDSLNLCTNGGAALLDDRMMLEDYLATHKPPRVVMLVHAYDVWMRDYHPKALAMFPQSVSELDQRLQPAGLSPSHQMMILGQRYFPLYNQHRSLQRLIYHPGKMINRQWSWTPAGFDVQTVRIEALWRRDILEHFRNIQNKNDLQLSQANKQELATINALAQAHDFHVLLVMSPIAKELYQQPAFAEAYHRFTDHLRAVAAQSPKMHLVFDRPITVTRLHMQNADHVLHDAAGFYTDQLIKQIRPYFESPPKPVDERVPRN